MKETKCAYLTTFLCQSHHHLTETTTPFSFLFAGFQLTPLTQRVGSTPDFYNTSLKRKINITTIRVPTMCIAHILFLIPTTTNKAGVISFTQLRS